MKESEECRVDPTETLEAVHALMHLFAPQNHDYIEGVMSNGEPARGLLFYSDIWPYRWTSNLQPYNGKFGGILFGESDVELQIVEKDDCGIELLEVLTWFDYDDRDLLQHIVQCLPDVGIFVPEEPGPEVNAMQEVLLADWKLKR